MLGLRTFDRAGVRGLETVTPEAVDARADVEVVVDPV
jgi:hypothetical protein